MLLYLFKIELQFYFSTNNNYLFLLIYCCLVYMFRSRDFAAMNSFCGYLQLWNAKIVI